MIDVKKYKNNSDDKNRSLTIFYIIFALLAIFVLVGKFFTEYISYIEVSEIGKKYVSIFFKNLSVKYILQIIWMLIIFLISLFSLLFVRMNLTNIAIDSGILKKKRVIVLIGIIFAFMFSSAFSENMYEKYLHLVYGGSFNMQDPLFGKDIGYYIFKRPFMFSVVNSLYDIWLIFTILIFAAYFIFMSMFNAYKLRDFMSIKSVGIHNIINLTVLIVLKASQYIFKSEELLFGSFGEFVGAGYTDITIWLNYYRIMPVVLLVITVFAILFFYKGKYKSAVKALLIFPAIWGLTLVLSVAFQYLFVSPNEVLRESKNIENNIKYTKAAYNIENVGEINFDVKNDFTADDIEKNKNTLDNIRILDLDSNLVVLNQIQGIRNYYKFNETDIIPYTINGEKSAIAITPREITKENLSDTSDTYINRTLRYTHGFGVVANPINRVSSQGQPEFLVKDIPPKSVDGIEKITEPRIYFGELTRDYVVVGSKKYKELDYSEGQEDIEYTYKGKAGVKLSFINRLLFASKYGDFRLLVSSMFSSDSKILINRNIVERIKKVAPFFEYDKDPYMIIDKDGKLKWIVDAYTSSINFPYAQYYGDKNYIRNSVKVVVDAYEGDVKFYISDKDDPIALMYKNAYPDLFETEELGEDIKEHIKYPEYLFSIQADIYSKYHIDNPTAFYNKNDMWVIAKEKYGISANEERTVAPYYNLMKLEGSNEGELLLSIPYTLSNKDNMVSQLAVRNEWENYGELFVYKFPKDINVYGPMQIENRINSDTEISSALTLWSQGGSKVIRGNMMIVPIKNSLLYIEPLYMMSQNQSTLPELKQVIVAYDEKIVMKSNISEALYALFGKSVPENSKQDITLDNNVLDIPIDSEDVEYEDAKKAVIDSFKGVKEALGNGDWENFGVYMNELEKSILDLESEE